MNIPLLKTERLCKEFPTGSRGKRKVRAVDCVDLLVAPGESRGIVGESGSGKTTLARCRLKLVEPSSGSVYFDGQDLASLSGAKLRKKRREFQMVFQDPYGSLNPAMGVEDIILEPMQVHRSGTREEQRQRLRELLDAVSLDETMAKRRPGELSGGQQQRVGIARALALKPRLLVADEPVSALDISVQAQILNLLSGLKGRYDLTLILISHSLYTIHYLCTHVSVMYRGRIVEEASTGAFFENPKHPYSRELMESAPVLDPSGRPHVPASKKDSRSHPVSLSGCVFQPKCPRSFAPCREQIPPLKEVAPGQKAACFLY